MAIIQIPMLVLAPSTWSLACEAISTLFLLVTSVCLIIKVILHHWTLAFPKYGLPSAMVISIVSVVVSAILQGSQWRSAKVSSSAQGDNELATTACESAQLSLNKSHQTAPPPIVHLDLDTRTLSDLLRNKPSEKTLVVPVVEDETALNLLMHASMVPTADCWGTRNWMNTGNLFELTDLARSKSMHLATSSNASLRISRSNTTGHLVVKKLRFPLKSMDTLVPPSSHSRLSVADLDVAHPIPWTSSSGMRTVSLEEWEQNRLVWMSNSSHLGVSAQTQHRLPHPLYTSQDVNMDDDEQAPSLHTYRAASGPSSSSWLIESELPRCITPPPNLLFAPIPEVDSAPPSPIKKMILVFKRRDSSTEVPRHKHSYSAVLVMSGISVGSSRPGSPKKAIRALFQKGDSSPTQSKDLPGKVAHLQLHLIALKNLERLQCAPQNHRAFDDWETSDHSRVSSLPSAVIGEYDKEKWRKLKEMQQEPAWQEDA